MERKIPFRCDKISVCSSHRHLIVSRVLIRSIVKSGDSIAWNSCAGFKSVVLNGTTYDLRRVTVNRKPDLLRIKNYTQTFRIRIKIYMCGSTVFLTFPIFFFCCTCKLWQFTRQIFNRIQFCLHTINVSTTREDRSDIYTICILFDSSSFRNIIRNLPRFKSFKRFRSPRSHSRNPSIHEYRNLTRVTE